MIVIEPYNPNWPKDFEIIKVSLQNVLGDLALRIDHIGSTSVPGLGAKDVIDVQVTVKELFAEIEEKLTRAGYPSFGSIRSDHVPSGEDSNPDLWAKFLFNEIKGQRRANIHIRKLGNPNQRYPLLFRDYLRAHPKSAQTIELIKREIAKRHPEDWDAYYDIKDPVYDLIWEAALEWENYRTGGPKMDIGIFLGIFLGFPFLALLPAGIFAFMFVKSKGPIILITALVWLAYFLYEQAIKLQLLCSGDCNIRIDLLLIYPTLLMFSALAIISHVKRLNT